MFKFNPLEHPICFSHPLRVSSTPDLPHVPVAMFLVDILRPEVLVQLGAGDGTIYCAYTQAVRQLRLSTRCFAIVEFASGNGSGPAEYEDLQAHHDELYGEFSQLIPDTAEENISSLATSSIDLLHVGSLDSVDSLERWLHKMSNRGVVVVNSIRDEGFHVSKIWQELMAAHPHFEFSHPDGFAVFSVGREMPERLLAIIEAAEGEASLIREFFRQSGERIKARLQKSPDLERLNSRVKDLFSLLQLKTLAVDEKERVIKSLLADMEVNDRDRERHRAQEEQLNNILNSRAWRWVTRYGHMKRRFLEPAYKLLRQTGQNGRRMPSRSFRVPRQIEPYEAWLEVNKWSARREAVLRDRLSKIADPPLLSVIMPVYNPSIEFLNKAIQSVVDQVYENWELCIADDASTNPAVSSTLKTWAGQDTRIRVTTREENGNISLASNSAVASASGEYIVFLDQDDELTPDALGEVACYLAEHRDTDVLYSDDDKIDAAGHRYGPQFKPDWSPELLLSYMYFSHLFVIRRELFNEVGGMRVGFEGSQDYDLALRTTERAKHVGHVPKVLYHWRALPNSTAASGDAKPQSFAAGLKSVQHAFERRNTKAEVIHPDWAVAAKCGIFTHRFPNEGPSVAVIIPTRNNLELLTKCIDSIAKTTYRNYEVVILDNESDDEATLNYLRTTPHKVLRIATPAGFNFAALNNRAVEQVQTDYVLFLNNDIEVISPTWLSAMVGYMSMPGVGAVGARLLFPDGRIQHAGVVHGYYNRMAGPAFKLMPATHSGYLAYAKVTRNYSAVTAACMLTSKELFADVGGFDEQAFAVAYNDVDYCYRLHAAGHRIVYCPQAELIHHEGASRGFRDNPIEAANFLKQYGDRVDPYYNPNLSLDDERFAIGARTVAAGDLQPIPALMCAFNLNREGAPYSQFELTVKLKEQGIIDPIVYSPVDGALRQLYEDKGIEVIVRGHPLTGATSLADYETGIEAFSRQLMDLKIELVYGNTLQTFYAIAAAHQAGLPSVWNPRESDPWATYFDYLPREIAGQALQCFAYPYQVVFVSKASRQVWQRLNSRHNFMVVHNGLDRERFGAALKKWPKETARAILRIPGDERAVVIIGTICERKGQMDLVEALGKLLHSASTRTFIVGSAIGAYAQRVRKAVRALPYSYRSRVEIVEETSDPALYYAAADIFVCCSRIESFPRVILEALAARLPIITTPVFGISEQVKDNETALFYTPGDTTALANAIDKLIANPKLADKLAANTVTALDSLIDIDSMVDEYAKVFREAWLSSGTRMAAKSNPPAARWARGAAR